MMLTFKEFIQPEPIVVEEVKEDTFSWRYKNRDSWLADYRDEEYAIFNNIGIDGDGRGAIWQLSDFKEGNPQLIQQISEEFIKENDPAVLEIKVADLATKLSETTGRLLSENNVLVRE